jgi:SulP family sulfate permease
VSTETTEHSSARDAEHGVAGDSGHLISYSCNRHAVAANPSGVPSRPFVPRLITCLRAYSLQDFAHDLAAGFTVGLVALPLAMAFGIASGVTPQAGLYTAVVAGFIISALGGSRVQIGGPTGAFVVIVAGIIVKFGPSGLLVVTLMAGFLLVAMALTGLGAAVKYIPRPVTIGFTNGIAVLIASTQIKDFFGLTTSKLPGDFSQRLMILLRSAHSVRWTTVAIGVLCLAIIVFWPRINQRLPGSILALLIGTGIVTALHLPLETIGSTFGGIPVGLPKFAIPAFRPELILLLFPSALTVALLAAVESLLSAVVADGMIGDRHESNTELLAQGLANIASPLFGGIPATGAIARTATNIRSGARTPVAGMIHACTLLLILLVAAPLAKYIPLATLAAVLLVVSYNMGEWQAIPNILRLSWADKLVWIVTFGLTVFADLTVAVEVGIALAALLYIHRISQTTTVTEVDKDYIRDNQPHILQDKQVPPYVTILRIHGPFLFGTTDKLADVTANLHGYNSIVILRLRNMTALDATGLHEIEKLAQRLRQSGRILLLCGAREQPARLLRQAEFVEHVGEENILPHVQAALERANQIASGFEGLAPEAIASLRTAPL